MNAKKIQRETVLAASALQVPKSPRHNPMFYSFPTPNPANPAQTCRQFQLVPGISDQIRVNPSDRKSFLKSDGESHPGYVGQASWLPVRRASCPSGHEARRLVNRQARCLPYVVAAHCAVVHELALPSPNERHNRLAFWGHNP